MSPPHGRLSKATMPGGCCRRGAILAVAFLMAVLDAGTASAALPMQYLTTSGPGGVPGLLWWLLGVSVFVILLILVLVLAGVLFRTSRTNSDDVAAQPVLRSEGSGLAWIWGGLIFTVLVLAGSVAWTAATLAAINRPPTEPGLTIEVRGHQWWWEVRYLSDDRLGIFTTANEIHIPVGVPVRFRLMTDRRHPFVLGARASAARPTPSPTSEHYLAAGRQARESIAANARNIAAPSTPIWGSTCIADMPAEFQKWMAGQLDSPSHHPSRSRRARWISSPECGVCHTVRGTTAGGHSGPT